MSPKSKLKEKFKKKKANESNKSRRAVRKACHNIDNLKHKKRDQWEGRPNILIYEEQSVCVQNMSRSPPPSPRSWYQTAQPGSAVGPPPMPNNTGERISPPPGQDQLPPEWYRWIDQYRRKSSTAHERSPPGKSTGIGHTLPHNHLPTPHTERPISPRIEHPRHLSPRLERHSDRRPSSPMYDRRPISPHADRRPCSPRTERRPPSPWSDRRAPSPRREKHLSPLGDRRPASPRPDRRPLSPHLIDRRALSPRPLERRPSGERRPLSPRRERLPSPRRERPLSPRRERLRSPPRHWRMSPPRHDYPPPDWRRRSRSPPPHWIRRSPPRYGPPPSRGRSPPKGHWPPPWERYSTHRDYKWAPPHYGGAGDHKYHWERSDRRMEPRPQVFGPPKPTATQPTKDPLPCPAPEVSKPASSLPKSDDGLVPPGEDKEEEIENFDLPEYDAEIPLGQKYVIAVSGYFCKICHKFYTNEQSAKITHCKSKAHYDKFSKWLSEKREVSLIQKREASSLEIPPDGNKDQPAKKLKLEENNNITKESDSEAKYDPTEPTTDISPSASNLKEESAAMEANQIETNKADEGDIKVETVINGEKRVDETSEDPPQNEEVPLTKECMEVDESISQNSEYASDSDALVTNDNKKENDGFVEATLYNFRKMRVTELKANLEKRGLKSTGLKTLLLKRLEKVLLEEVATEAAQSEEEESNEEPCKEEKLVIDDGIENGEINDGAGTQYVLNLHESDIEPNNNKTQWINERELERELMQLDGVKKINSITCLKNKVGRKSVVEWTVNLEHNGVISQEGLRFEMPSHQKLPYKAILAENESKK